MSAPKTALRTLHLPSSRPCTPTVTMPSIDPKPAAIDFTKYYSFETKNRKRSQLKQLRPYFDIPGMISFGGGYPHASTWPVNGMTLSIPFAGKSVFVPGYGNHVPEGMPPLEPYTAPLKDEPLRPDLADALQYSSTYGAQHLLDWTKEHIQRVHAPKYSEWANLLTAGNTDGVDAILRAIFDKGDYMLVEEFAYPGLMTSAESMGIKLLGVPLDTEGVDAVALDKMMASWDEAKMGGPRPKMLVLVPTCSNPCGTTVPEHRKREIYAVCRKWELLIGEDDPYCFLQIRPNGADSPIVPSFLSMDTDGRVVRVDSFSKIVAPGSRLGFVTAHKTLLEKIMNTREGATQSPSGFSVAAISATLRAWGGHEGFEKKYLPHISEVYAKRCYSLIELLNKYAPAEVIEIPKGSGGMFLWIRIKVESHPSFPAKDPEEISQQVFLTMVDEKVLVAPSAYFKAPSTSTLTKDEEAKRIYVRLSFSLPTPEEMEEGVIRLAKALKREWKI